MNEDQKQPGQAEEQEHSESDQGQKNWFQRLAEGYEVTPGLEEMYAGSGPDQLTV